MAEPSRKINKHYDDALARAAEERALARKSGKVTSAIDKVLNRGSNKLGSGLKYVGTSALNPLGIKPTKAATGFAIGAAAIWAVGSAINDVGVQRKQMSMGKVEEVGNLAALSYDAVGNVSNGKRDLGATGDIVFGLHNARRGR